MAIKSSSKPESTGGAEGTSGLPESGLDQLTELVIGAAIEVHRQTGPGLLEAVYEECLCYELALRGVSFKRQVHLPILYKGTKLSCGYKMDVLVEDSIVLQLKAVDNLLPIHSAQLLTYLKLSGKKVGLLLNFNEPLFTKGLKRLVNHFEDPREVGVPSAPSARQSGKESTNPKHHDTLKTRRPGVSAVK